MTVFGTALFIDGLDGEQALRAAVRLLAAAGLGAIVGLERQSEHKPTSTRMHMIVALGTALFAFVAVEAAQGELGRVIQGIATGVGFLGAGTIFKQNAAREVHGLTTAASIWLTAAAGLSVGAGLLAPAVLAVAFGWIILRLFPHGEARPKQDSPTPPEKPL
jgi:putative Mg2+ transporter-C (MgtC) family protein